MKIGEHEVTDITREGCMVGCQRVKLEEVKAVVRLMEAAPPDFQLKVGSGGNSVPGSVWLEQSGNGVTLKLRGRNLFDYSVLSVRPDGITFHSGCGDEKTGVGIPTGRFGGKDACVKIVGANY